MNKSLKSTIAKAPHGPGIYKFLDKTEELLYVGKAKDLRKRLQSYIRPSVKHGIKNQKLMEAAESVEWVEVNSDMEALILEDNLIKENQPKYNVLLKDSKTFQYIKVTVQKEYPELLTVRKIQKDGAKYFGPKTSGMDVQRIVESARRIFKLCSQKNITVDPEGTPLEGAKVAVKVGGTTAKRPCLDYHIKRCTGPCAGMVTPEEYGQQIQDLLRFLSGDFKPAIESLKKQMTAFASSKKFERAASLRDQIAAIERSAEKQIITDTLLSDRDVVAYVEDLGKNYFVLFQIRGGRLINQEKFISEGGETPAQIMEAFLMDYYSRAADIPKEIILSINPSVTLGLQAYISSQTDHKVKLLVPKLGHKDQLISLAEKNARSFAQQSRVRWMVDERKGEKALDDLVKALNLDETPKRIECYDISHLGGTETIGSMVVFKKGEPAKKDYRQFRLRSTANKNDDFKSMEEVITRRLNYLPAQLPEGYGLRKMKKSEADFIDHVWENLHDPSYKQFYVIEHEKAIIALARLCHLSDKIDELSALWVHPDHQGKKLGSFLLHKLIQSSRQKRLYLFADESLEDYYLKMGFELIKKAPDELQKKVQSIFEDKTQLSRQIYFAYQKKKQDTSFTARPDLIVIDGGKGQLHAAHDVLFAKGLNIPMISLAKREEEVFFPGKSEPIDLPKNSEANYLLQRLRDEAHRFAITANRNSRNKTMTQSALDGISGVGPKMKKKLITYFGSVAKVRQASQVQLEQLVGETLARRIKESL